MMLSSCVRFCGGLVAVTMMAASTPGPAEAQARAASQVRTVAVSEPPAAEKDLGATQEKLLKLLRVSPTLTSVVASDPALLANAEYVSRNNPELQQFLALHPEIGRNPGFYLFSDLHGPGQKHYELLEPKEGFQSSHPRYERSETQVIMDELGPVFALIFCIGGAIWLLRIVVENRRWGRTFKLQSEVHGKLIEKFGTSQELMAYMDTEAGRRFLEAAPIATQSDQQQMPNVVSRVLLTMQIGVVLTLLGAGLLWLRHSVGEGATAMLVLGVVVLMPGIGFMISAAMTWVLARRLGLMPAGLETRQ